MRREYVYRSSAKEGRNGSVVYASHRTSHRTSFFGLWAPFILKNMKWNKTFACRCCAFLSLREASRATPTWLDSTRMSQSQSQIREFCSPVSHVAALSSPRYDMNQRAMRSSPFNYLCSSSHFIYSLRLATIKIPVAPSRSYPYSHCTTQSDSSSSLQRNLGPLFIWKLKFIQTDVYKNIYNTNLLLSYFISKKVCVCV